MCVWGFTGHDLTRRPLPACCIAQRRRAPVHWSLEVEPFPGVVRPEGHWVQARFGVAAEPGKGSGSRSHGVGVIPTQSPPAQLAGFKAGTRGPSAVLPPTADT